MQLQKELEEKERQLRESLAAAAAKMSIPKPDTAMSGEEAYLRRARLSSQANPSLYDSETVKKAKTDRSVSLIPTKLVLFQNMVGKGQVDADLEAETAEECAKFGAVTKCVVHETKDKSVSDAEAVRIFVLFGTIDSAQKALGTMNGRYFGGRQVKAAFANEARFGQGDYEP